MTEALISVPRTRVTAGAVIRDDEGRVLLLEPTYRPDWLTPGDSVEADESPARAAAREVAEELGVALPIGRLLVTQWERDVDDSDGVLHLAYDGGVANAATIAGFRLEHGIASFRFTPPEMVPDLASTITATRVAAALQAHARHIVIELDDR